MEKFVPEIEGNLRKHMVKIPEVIQHVSGIRIFGKLIKSILFSTDVAIIKNCNANAVIAVYPFTPQPIITHSIISASDIPVFCGVGGGTTTGKRVVNLAMDAEFQGAIGVVVNAPTSNEVVIRLREKIDIPIVVTVVSEKNGFKKAFGGRNHHLQCIGRSQNGGNRQNDPGTVSRSPGDSNGRPYG